MFSSPGVCLRFTPNTPESSGPKPPLLSSGEKFCQGTLLEVRDGALIVAFQEVDMFHIEGDYRYVDLLLQYAGLTDFYLHSESTSGEMNPPIISSAMHSLNYTSTLSINWPRMLSS